MLRNKLTKQKKANNNNKKVAKKAKKVLRRIPTQDFSAQPDRSGLRKLPSTPKTVGQLERLKQLKDAEDQENLAARIRDEEERFEKRKATQTTTLRGNKRVGDLLNNDMTEKQLREMKEALNVAPSSPHLTRPQHSPYFIPMWDPELENSAEMRKSFENSTGLKYESMDLVGKTLLGEPVNLKQRLIQTNKVSLVQVVSTQRPLQFANVTAEIWMETLRNHGESNQDGAIVVEPTILNITEGFFVGLFLNKSNQDMHSQFGEHVQDNIISYHIKSDNDAISRARRYLDCRNRFVSNVFLVDERGMIRWRGGLPTEPTAEFMETLSSVTNDLILETKYNEADAV